MSQDKVRKKSKTFLELNEIEYTIYPNLWRHSDYSDYSGKFIALST